jgi:two-component system, NarL family, sensor kinase
MHYEKWIYMYDQDKGQMSKMEEPASLLNGNRELAVLYDIAGYLNRQIDVHEVLHEVLRRVTELLGLRTGWVWLLDDRNETYLAAKQNLPPYLADHPERLTGSCLCLDTFLSSTMGQASNVDVLRCSRLKNAERDSDPSALGLRFHASVPIHTGDRVLGVMNVTSEDWRELRPDELQLLHIISDQIGLAIQRAQLSAEHTHAATRLATIEERNRLAREIHDTLAQGLAAITLQLETADALFQSRPERAQETIQKALQLARSNLEEARHSVMDLRAAPLQKHSLTEALAALAVAEPVPVVDYTCLPTQHFPVLSARIETGLYRIAQEAVTNARKHAKAHKISMTLIAEEQRISLSVQDDGCGFDLDSVIQQTNRISQHFGLAGINERIKLLGGNLRISSEPGAGTSIEVSIPY